MATVSVSEPNAKNNFRAKIKFLFRFLIVSKCCNINKQSANSNNQSQTTQNQITQITQIQQTKIKN